MGVASHRHLVEQKWRKDGDLDLLVRYRAAAKPLALILLEIDGAAVPDECRPGHPPCD